MRRRCLMLCVLASLQYLVTSMPQAEKLRDPANSPARPPELATSPPQTLASQVSPVTEAITWLSLLVYWLLSLQPWSAPSGEEFSSVPVPSPSTVQSGNVLFTNVVLSSLTVAQTPAHSTFTIVPATPTPSKQGAETPRPTDLLSPLPTGLVGALPTDALAGAVPGKGWGNFPAVAFESVMRPATGWLP